MIARIIQLTTQPGKLQELVKAMAERNLPILKQQPGFLEAMVLTSGTQGDELIGIAIWKSQKNAEQYASGQGREVLEAMRPLLERMPTIRTFSLAASTAYEVGIGASSS
jgi:quinol monooxygenase YgiN